MPLFRQKTLNMAAGAGYLIDLGGGVGTMSILARAECFIRVSGPTSSAPSAPTATPDPASGAQASWLHVLASEEVTLGVDPSYWNGAQVAQDTMQYIEVWAVAAGYLVCNAH